MASVTSTELRVTCDCGNLTVHVPMPATLPSAWRLSALLERADIIEGPREPHKSVVTFPADAVPELGVPTCGKCARTWVDARAGLWTQSAIALAMLKGTCPDGLWRGWKPPAAFDVGTDFTITTEIDANGAHPTFVWFVFAKHTSEFVDLLTTRPSGDQCDQLVTLLTEHGQRAFTILQAMTEAHRGQDAADLITAARAALT